MDNNSSSNKDLTQNEKIGGMAGLGAGMIVGAEVGTAVLPIPLVGTFLGGLVGGALGSAVGQRVGSAFLSGVNAFWNDLTATGSSEGDKITKA